MDRLNPIGRREPRFDIDVKRGRQGELQIDELLKWIANGDGAVEVKTKSYIDAHFYVETHHDPGRRGAFVPSGISSTTAAAWAYCIEGTGIAVVFPTDLIREMLTDPSTKDREETDGSCPTRGKLISLLVTLFRLDQRRRLGRLQ